VEFEQIPSSDEEKIDIMNKAALAFSIRGLSIPPDETTCRYIESEFKKFFNEKAKKCDIDVLVTTETPDIKVTNTDIKTAKGVTPSTSAKVKSLKHIVFGLDYNILLFHYDDKEDKINFLNTIFYGKRRTGDKGLTLDLINEEENRIEVLQRYNKKKKDFFGNEAIEACLLKCDKEVPLQGLLTVGNPPDQWKVTYPKTVLKKFEEERKKGENLEHKAFVIYKKK